jgi:hypothetical protein
MTKHTFPKQGPILFLQIVLALIGVAALALMLWEPHLEGRNAGADLATIYLHDPFLVYAYVASIPFFVALYQAFILLKYIGRNEVFSSKSVKTLRIIKYCAIIIVGFIAGGVIILLLGESDDRPPILAMGTLTSFVAIVIATAAAVFERLLQAAIDIKSENDLTV